MSKKTSKKLKTGKATTAKKEERPEGWHDDPELIEKHGIPTGEDAYRILRGILERQDGENGPGDGDELYSFCEAFKALDEHMRTHSGQGPKIWRNV